VGGGLFVLCGSADQPRALDAELGRRTGLEAACTDRASTPQAGSVTAVGYPAQRPFCRGEALDSRIAQTEDA